MKKFLFRNYPLFVIFIIVLIISALNYSQGTFLTGGDNLHPEFNLAANIKRSIFSVWQEYQGVGLLGGMGHAADLLRQIVFIPLTIIFGADQVRWFYTFNTLIIGSVGAYFLIRRLIHKYWTHDLFTLNLAGLTGSLFYLLNLSTLQSYFTPFEVFTAHFAFLPWMILVTLNYFESPKTRNLLIAAIVLLIATPAAYVPTLFVVYGCSALIIALFYFQKTRTYLKTFIKFFGVTFLINSFWLLPFLFFSLTSTSINVNSKINQMATEGIFLQNKEFGHLADAALLRGFWFNNIEPNQAGDYVYMLSAWKDHLANPLIPAIGFIFFGVVLIGLIYCLKKRTRETLAISAIFVFTFTMIVTATPPFSIINDLIREHVPLFGQIFRFPFTKFSILASLSYAILFTFGLTFILHLKNKISRKIQIATFLLTIVALGIFMFPIFKGELFYTREKSTIPNEYFKTFEYFKTQDKNVRIANFPQYTFWGWNFYDWGYSGSGFIWYGIEQPIMDRAFDVWSDKNENYYWEMNQALYSKNPKMFEDVLNKYDIGFLLVDKNITNPSSAKSLFVQETEELISEIPNIKKVKEFGSIEIYKVTLKNPTSAFTSSMTQLDSVNAYNWSSYDQAFAKNGDYYSNEAVSEYFPFRSIFAGKTSKDIAYSIENNKDSVDFTSSLPPTDEVSALEIPSLITANNTIPVNIIAKKNDGNINISLEIRSPEVYIKTGDVSKKVWENSIEENLFNIQEDSYPLFLNINGTPTFQISELTEGETKVIGSTTLTMTDTNKIIISTEDEAFDGIEITGDYIKEIYSQDQSFITLNGIPKDTTLIVRVKKLNDAYSSIQIDPIEEIAKNKSRVTNCDNFRKDFFSYIVNKDQSKELLELSSQNATPCISFYLPTLDHDQAYLMTVEHKNIEGRGLHLWVLNEDQKTPVLDTYFTKNKEFETEQIIIPPMEKFGKAYSVHFDNISIGKFKSGNQLGDIEVTPIPYYFLTNLSVLSENGILSFEKANIQTKHPNHSLYLVKSDNKEDYFLSLSQGYSPFWKAYYVNGQGLFTKIFPFIGKPVKDHFMVNNWKNGWIINNPNANVAIIYIPQYLQYLGFILTLGTLIVLIVQTKRHSRRTKNPENH